MNNTCGDATDKRSHTLTNWVEGLGVKPAMQSCFPFDFTCPYPVETWHITPLKGPRVAVHLHVVNKFAFDAPVYRLSLSLARPC